MSRVTEYREQLRSMAEPWEPFLLEESRLPGPRANLELVHAVAEEGGLEQFLALLEHGPEAAPTGAREEFLPVCGAVGLGRCIAEGRRDLMPLLRTVASDPRWRVREGVAMALQRIGDTDLPWLLDQLRSWAAGTRLEQRAAVAGLCEPRLLSDEARVGSVLDLLDSVTASIRGTPDRKSEELRVLRQALGYCWSVAIVASPAAGRRRFDGWIADPDPDVRWVVRENLRKKRLARMDADWVARSLERIATRSAQ